MIRRNRAAWRSAVISLLVLACGACATLPNLRFSPPIQDAELRDGEELHARIAVAWRGLVERDGVVEMRFRCRIENPRATPFALEPAEFELLDGALASYGLARTSELPATLEPGQSATFDLAFAVPGSKDLRGPDLAAVELRARLDRGTWSWATRFERAEPYYYYDPYYDPWHFHFGAYYCHG